MITTLEAIDMLWTYLSNTELKTVIGGKIYKNVRPQNAKAEDVVVGALVVSSTQLQEGIFNVNIFVPNLVVPSNGTQDASQPNHPRLKDLAAIAAPLLTDLWLDNGSVSFSIENQFVFLEPDKNEHYINFRLRAFFVNL